MKDSFNRKINYLRISVTDRCNLRCKYCMPESGVETFDMSEILTYEEIARVCQEAAALGITKVRLTGGEPLVRRGVTDLVRLIHDIPGIETVTMTTNGILLPSYLDTLVHNGLSGVNISLDTLDHEAFRQITGQDQLDQVLEGIHAALQYPIRVKVNAVLLPEHFCQTKESDWLSLLSLAKELPIDLRFIEMMPIGEGQQYYELSTHKVLGNLRSLYPNLQEDSSVHGAGPAVYYKIPGFAGSIGLIEAIHGKFCQNCNRIRMSATGQIKPCLCYADTLDMRAALRGRGKATVREVLIQAIHKKPAAHCFEQPADISEGHKMVSIGG